MRKFGNSINIHELIAILYVRNRTSLVAQMIKNLPANAGGPGLIPGSGRSPGEEDGNPPQCLCLKNSIDRRPWCATVYGVTKSETHIRIHRKTHICTHISHIRMKTHIHIQVVP